MRRPLAAAALAVLVATVSACGGDSDSGSTAAAPPADTAANTAQVCADAEKVVEDSTKKFAAEITKTLTAAATGDKSVTDTAVAEVKELFTVWADGIRGQAGKALDPELKTALTTMSEQLDKVASNVKSVDDLQNADKLLDSPEFKAADQKLTELCGSS